MSNFCVPENLWLSLTAFSHSFPRWRCCLFSCSSFFNHSRCAAFFTDPWIVQAAFNNHTGSIEGLRGPRRGTCCAWALRRNIRASLSQAENGDRAISVLATKSRLSFLRSPLKLIVLKRDVNWGLLRDPDIQIFWLLSPPREVLLSVDVWWVLLMYSKLLFKRMYVFSAKVSN